MFALNFIGSNADAATALGNLSSSETTGVEPDLVTLIAVYAARLITPNDTIAVGNQFLGDLRLKVQGHWKPNTIRILIEVDAIEELDGKIAAKPSLPPNVTATT